MPQPRSYQVIATLVAAVSTTALAGCGFVAAGNKSPVKPSSFVITGTAAVRLPAGTAVTPGATCTSPVGAHDIAADAIVIVTNPSGAKLASGQLGSGVVSGDGTACGFPFQIRSVTGGFTTYGVAVGNRPAQTFQAADLRANEPAILTIIPTSP